MADYYIEKISTEYPACNAVKDPFLHKVAAYANFSRVSRWWNSDMKTYRLAFEDSRYSTSLMFSHDSAGHPCQVEFKVGESVVAKLEALSMAGHVVFIAKSWHWLSDKNVVWPAYWTKDQVEIRLDLEGQ